MAHAWRARRWPSHLERAWNRALQDHARSSVIVVAASDPVERAALLSALSDEYCRLRWADNKKSLEAALRHEAVDLLILDGESICTLDCCRAVKADPATELVPILIIGPEPGVGSQIEALDAGADDFLSRPFHPRYFQARVRSLMRHKSAINRLEETEAALMALAEAVERRDCRTGDHCDRMAVYSLALGLSLHLPWGDLMALYRGGFLHDIGKIAIPDAVLFKRGPLDESEWREMKTHPARGEAICRPLRSLDAVRPIVRHHHERWDGSGYPDRLRGPEIPMLARVLQMADIYDALISERPYKASLTPDAAIGVLMEETAKGWRDPELMDHFRSLHATGVLREIAGAVGPGTGAFQRDLACMQERMAAAN